MKIRPPPSTPAGESQFSGTDSNLRPVPKYLLAAADAESELVLWASPAGEDEGGRSRRDPLLSGAGKDLIDLEFPIEFSPGEEFALLDLVEGAAGESDEGTLGEGDIANFLGGLWADTLGREAAAETVWDTDTNMDVELII
jgi:hypothetical protein